VTPRRFYLLLGLIVLLGFAVRMIYMFTAKWDQSIWGDAFTYHYTANGIADGLGFQAWLPDVFLRADKGVPDFFDYQHPETWGLNATATGAAAENPPLFPLYLAAFSFVGLRSWHAHMIASTLLGTASVFVIGLVGRKIVSARVGLLAALIAAVYANLWVYDPLVLSESMGILAGAFMVLMAYRAWEKPTLSRMVWLGVTFGVAALVRSEFALLMPFVVIPLVIRAMPGRAVKDRIGYLAASGAVALLVVSPWVVRNLTLFERPTYLSHDAGLSLKSSSCDETFYGESLGWWSPECVIDGKPPKGVDPSVGDEYWRKEALAYIGDNLDRFPVVALARVGRMWQVFRPGTPWGSLESGDTLGFTIVEGRSEKAARLALAQYWLLMPFAIAGFVILWRRKVPVGPLLALPVLATIVAVYAFGNLRYRSISEVALVATAAVAVDALLCRWWPKRFPAEPRVDWTPSGPAAALDAPPGDSDPEPPASDDPSGDVGDPELQPA
jgi:4-amino-4-deoxy-L-arabinose transferase-like glycosyltransferase